MKNENLTEDKAEQTSTGGVLVGKREGQTIIHNKGSLSGYLVGKTHAEGGIKAINKSTGQPLEMQGGEVVITAPAVSDNTKREFEGKMMTNREILSAINEKGGGVAFANGGDVPKSIKHTGASYKYGGKTMTDHDILKHIAGGHLAEGYSLREIANIHQVPLSELKEQVRLGMKAESEHTPNKREQMKIVKDHLFENPKYYTLLKKAGLENGGGLHRESLVKDAKSGNTPARDLNNYNDVLDLQADNMVGADTGLYADGGIMANGGYIAPNGEPSNLKPKLYKLVRTKEFKDWFGDWENDPKNSSKIVDRNGEPMIVYHGTKNDFYQFDTNKQLKGWLGRGFYFTKNKIEAKDYGNRLLKCFLNIRNPFVVEGDKVNPDGTISWSVGREGEISKKYGYVDADDISKTLKHFKHDGIIEADMISCFNPTQIKLADETNINFDSSNPDIRYEIGGVFHGSPYNFDKFSTSKMGSGIGQQEDGWGIYLTDNKEATKNYGKYIYETTLFKNKSLGEYNFIDLKKPVKKDIVTKILKAVYKKYNKDFDIIEFNQYYDYIKDKSLPKVDFNDYDLVEFDYAGYLFYKTLSRILGGDKNASLFLLDNGIDGLKASFENSKGVYRTDYIIFDENAITIENQEYLPNNYYATGGDVKPYDANMEGDSAHLIKEEKLTEKEINETIETLEILYESSTRKEKKDIKEAIEVLKMILNTY
jgi:hypothetical protein